MKIVDFLTRLFFGDRDQQKALLRARGKLQQAIAELAPHCGTNFMFQESEHGPASAVVLFYGNASGVLWFQSYDEESTLEALAWLPLRAAHIQDTLMSADALQQVHRYKQQQIRMG